MDSRAGAGFNAVPVGVFSIAPPFKPGRGLSPSSHSDRHTTKRPRRRAKVGIDVLRISPQEYRPEPPPRPSLSLNSSTSVEAPPELQMSRVLDTPGTQARHPPLAYVEDAWKSPTSPSTRRAAFSAARVYALFAHQCRTDPYGIGRSLHGRRPCVAQFQCKGLVSLVNQCGRALAHH